MERIGGLHYDFGKDDSAECRICSSFDSGKSAFRVLSTLDWDFFYCFGCKNWFQVSQANHDIAYLITSSKKLDALNYFLHELDSTGSYLVGAKMIRRVFQWLSNFLLRLVSPELTEDS
jgi:hypothetical protein